MLHSISGGERRSSVSMAEWNAYASHGVDAVANAVYGRCQRYRIPVRVLMSPRSIFSALNAGACEAAMDMA